MPQFYTDIAQNVEAGARQYLFRNQRSSRKMCSFPISRALDTAIYPPHNAGNIEAAQKNARMCRVQPRLYAQSINRAFCLHGSLERGSDAHIQLVRSSSPSMDLLLHIAVGSSFQGAVWTKRTVNTLDI